VEPGRGYGRFGPGGIQRLRLAEQRVGATRAGPGVADVDVGYGPERSDDLLLRRIGVRQRR
jgi:hypothetical protein